MKEGRAAFLCRLPELPLRRAKYGATPSVRQGVLWDGGGEQGRVGLRSGVGAALRHSAVGQFALGR